MPFSSFMIWWKAIIALIFLSNVFWPGSLFSQFLYLKIMTMTSYIQLLQHNIQDYKQLQTFFRNFSLLKFILYSKKAKTWFISLYNTEVSIRMHDHWSQCPDNNEEGKVSIVCPVDNDCPVFGKLQLLYPGLIWGSA